MDRDLLSFHDKAKIFVKPFYASGNSGVFLPMFAVLATFLVGAISYSFYVGQQVQRRIELQNSSDAAALAASYHAAQGLNMIAANNLTIGASLHVATTLPIVAAYASAVYAVTATIIDSAEAVGKVLTDQLSPILQMEFADRYQQKVWNRLAPITSIYMQTAAGTTAFNKILQRTWLLPALSRSVHTARLNQTESVGYLVQANFYKSIGALLPTQYKGLEQTEVQQAMCQTIKASRTSNAPQSVRDNFVRWLIGPMLSFEKEGIITPKIAGIVSFLTKFLDFAHAFLPAYITFTDCGWGVKSSWLGYLHDFAKKMTEGQKFASPPAVATYAHAFDSHGPSADYDFRAGVIEGVPTTRECDVQFILNKSATMLLAGANSELNSRHTLYKTLEKMRDEVRSKGKSKSAYYCTIHDSRGYVVERRRGYFEHTRADGTKVCIDPDTTDINCVFKDFIKPGPLACGKIKNRMKNWSDNTCKDYDFLKHNQHNITSEAQNFGRMMEAYTDKVGKSPKKIAELRAQIGFQYIENFQAFEDSVSFVQVQVNPFRRFAETQCQARAGNICIQPHVADFANPTGTFAPVDAQHSADAGMQDMLQGSWNDTWSKSQFAVSMTKVSRDTSLPVKQRMFWPDWSGYLESDINSMAQGMLIARIVSTQIKPAGP